MQVVSVAPVEQGHRPAARPLSALPQLSQLHLMATDIQCLVRPHPRTDGQIRGHLGAGRPIDRAASRVRVGRDPASPNTRLFASNRT